MDDNGGGRVQSRDEDRLSNLPESLLFQVLLNLPTKDVVKTSVLSSRWRNLWKFVPGLDLEYSDFPEYKAFVSFADKFLGFNGESCLHKCKLDFDRNANDEPYIFHFKRWFNTVVERKVQHLHVSDDSPWVAGEIQIPPTVYTCESLVSLKLCCVTLPNPEFVSLPCVKAMVLDMVEFANGLAFEMLISGCPVLESLTLWRSECDNIKVLRVCSQSLLSFALSGSYSVDNMDGVHIVAIDAPMLEYLELDDDESDSFIITNSDSLVKVDIDIVFNLYSRKRFDPNDSAKRSMIRNFLLGISGVKVMHISPHTLEVIYDYSRCERLPLFRNLSFLYVDFFYRWETLPIFLESCPNLKSLVLEFCKTPEEGVSILTGPQRLLTSLEYVKIVNPMADEETVMKVSYFLENSTILKKLTLCLHDSRKKEESDILQRLLTIPRLSTSCQVEVLWSS